MTDTQTPTAPEGLAPMYCVALWTWRGLRAVAAGVGPDYKSVAHALAEREGAYGHGSYWVRVRTLPQCSAPDCTIPPQPERTAHALVKLAEAIESRHDAETRVAIGTARDGAFVWEDWRA